MPYKDPKVQRQKNKEYQKKYYQKNKKYYVQKAREGKKKIKKWFQEYKQTLQCSRCSENHPAALDFHHIDPTTKKFRLAEAPHRGYGKKRILEEVAKCIVLCSNCHRKEHY